MVDITSKSNTLRKAVAVATLHVSREETMSAIREKRVPKGDVFEFARAAGLLGIKRTSDVIPDCHPLPIEYAHISFSMEEELQVHIRVEVHTIYKTGVEVESMHGAAVTALTMYDMLKPIDKLVRIVNIALESKVGGKSTFPPAASEGLKCAVIVCSDSISAGQGNDQAGKLLVEKLEGYNLKNVYYKVISDDPGQIAGEARQLVGAAYDLVLFTGGTGLSPRDNTPDALAPLLDREIPGIVEAMRKYGQDRMPRAMLSRGVAGFMKDTLIICFPGSAGGARDGFHAIFPHVLHVFDVKKGKRHDT